MEEKKLSDEVFYKGYFVIAIPHKLVDSGKWSMDIHIRKDYGSHVVNIPYSASNIWDSREDVQLWHASILDVELLMDITQT